MVTPRSTSYKGNKMKLTRNVFNPMTGKTDERNIIKKPRPKDNRVSSSRRGYGNSWRKIRVEILKKNNIPKEQWPLYDIDHNPPYNPSIEPNHRKYKLIPRLHADHSKKTVKCDEKRDTSGRFIKND